MKVTEGYMPFGKYETYYRIVGKSKDGKKPLLLLHGGPGSTHNYFEVLDDVAKDGRAVIMYDQIGCGKSSMPDRPELWTAETWTDELIQLRKHLNLDEVHILGQSWGGMLAIHYACTCNPEGIKSYILSSAHHSSELWEKEQRRRIAFLPEDTQEAIKKADASHDYSTKEYKKAEAKFMLRYCAGPVDENSPECLRRPKKAGRQAYVKAWGENEFSPSGTLKDFDFMDEINNIQVPTLITSGLTDLCSPLIAKSMYDRIPNSKWELFEFSRHMPFVEENEKYIKILTDWLNKND